MKKKSSKNLASYSPPLMVRIAKMTALFISKKAALFIILLALLGSCKKEASSPEVVIAKPQAKASALSTISLLQVDPLFPSAGISCNTDLIETSLKSNGWNRTFVDNFNSIDVDASKWNIITGAGTSINGNNELQYYQQSNLKLINGNLHIIVRNSSTLTAINKYTSGRIESKSYFSPTTITPVVRMYARIKLPAGYGMWPAFWSYGDRWPTNGEIDILEARGQEHTKFETNYFYGTEVGTNLVTDPATSFDAGVDLTSCYHIFYVEWRQNTLKFYIDGLLVATKTGGYISDLFAESQRVTLNVAVGGKFFGPSFNPLLIQPGTMYVDWVKVFVK